MIIWRTGKVQRLDEALRSLDDAGEMFVVERPQTDIVQIRWDHTEPLDLRSPKGIRWSHATITIYGVFHDDALGRMSPESIANEMRHEMIHSQERLLDSMADAQLPFCGQSGRA